MAEAVKSGRFEAEDSRTRGARVRLPVVGFGLALSIFFSLSYVLCVIGYVIAPDLPVAHGALALFLPGFQLGNWPRLLLGFVESFAWGWYIALVFGPLYNFFAARTR